MSETILPAFFSGQKIGTMLIEPSGIKTSFTVRCSRPAVGEIFRAWAVFEGARLLVGVMQPLDGGLFARRAFSRMELKSAGAEQGREMMAEILGQGQAQPQVKSPPLAREEGPKSSDGWQSFDPAAVRISDAALSRALNEATGVLYKKDKGGVALAAPLRRGEPFAFAPLFCLVSPRIIGERAYGVLSVDNGGRPRGAST